MNEVVPVLAEEWDCIATGFIDVFILSGTDRGSLDLLGCIYLTYGLLINIRN